MLEKKEEYSEFFINRVWIKMVVTNSNAEGIRVKL